jgi:dTDP-4-dehydrorhamnose reductase
MKVIILGSDGMLGHMLLRKAPQSWQIYSSTRNDFVGKNKFYFDLDSTSDAQRTLLRNINYLRPDIVINCIGYIKQREEIHKSKEVLINSWLPHMLNDLSIESHFKLIHFSTDCVFSGKKGMYTISDQPDPIDHYGLSKYAGEVASKNTLTLRTSIIGHEVKNKKSLLEWFLAQDDKCDGYSKAIYSGLTTLQLSKYLFEYIIPSLINNKINGIHQLASPPINKYDLLTLISEVYKKKIEIKKNSSVQIDRSLMSTSIFKLLKMPEPLWPLMVREMHEDFLAHQHLYKNYVTT